MVPIFSLFNASTRKARCHLYTGVMETFEINNLLLKFLPWGKYLNEK